MASLDGEAWGKIILLSFAVFVAVELEKWIGPKVLYPVFGPISRFFDPFFAACGSALGRIRLPCGHREEDRAPVATPPSPVDVDGISVDIK
jgi:hypothetical protein